MKILAIGDPHGNVAALKEIPKKDVSAILVTGDIGKADLARTFAFRRIDREKQGLPKVEETADEARQMHYEIYDSSVAVMKYLGSVAPSFTIYGNVEPSNADVRKNRKEYPQLDLPFLTDKLKSLNGVSIMNNRVVKFGNIRVGGLEYFVDDCWVKEFKPKDYRKRLANAKKQTVSAKKVLNRFGYVDVLVCHQPPYGILDKVTNPHAPQHWIGKHAGSKLILDYIKKFQPKYVFCGHIHEGEGHVKVGKTEVYNLGVCGYHLFDLS